MDVSEVLKIGKEKKKRRKDLIETLLENIHKRILFHAKNSRQNCEYQIPPVISGLPLFNINEIAIDIYKKFTGEDPKDVPMNIFPAVHYSMGGLWTDYEADGNGLIEHGSPRNQATSIPGLYAGGEADYQYHGANRLGANSLLSCIYTGLMMCRGIFTYIDNLDKSVDDIPSTTFGDARSHWESRLKEIREMKGKENPYQLHKDLGDIMMGSVLIVRDNKKLEKTVQKIYDAGYNKLGMPDPKNIT